MSKRTLETHFDVVDDMAAMWQTLTNHKMTCGGLLKREEKKKKMRKREMKRKKRKKRRKVGSHEIATCGIPKSRN